MTRDEAIKKLNEAKSLVMEVSTQCEEAYHHADIRSALAGLTDAISDLAEIEDEIEEDESQAADRRLELDKG